MEYKRYLTHWHKHSKLVTKYRMHHPNVCHKKVAHEAQPSVSLMFLPHFDVLCDLLLNRRTATWNIIKNENIGKKAVLFQISPLWQTRKQHFDVICCLFKMRRTGLVAMLSKELWLVQIQNSQIQKNLKWALSSSVRLSSNRREPIRMREWQ